MYGPELHLILRFELQEFFRQGGGVPHFSEVAGIGGRADYDVFRNAGILKGRGLGRSRTGERRSNLATSSDGR